MIDQHDSHGNGPIDEKELRSALHKAGWVETTAYVEPGTPVASGGGRGGGGDGGDGGDGGKRGGQSPEAKKKAEERERRLAEGWRQHNVMAPDDAESRELLSHLAQKIKSRTVRRNVRAVLADPGLVAIGRRVRRLRGDVADQVRKLLGL